jgi:hypothetical protein
MMAGNLRESRAGERGGMVWENSGAESGDDAKGKVKAANKDPRGNSEETRRTVKSENNQSPPGASDGAT